MKRIKSLILMLLSIFILVGCNNASKEDKESNIEDAIIIETEITDELTPSKELYWGVKDNILYISAVKTEKASIRNTSVITSENYKDVPWRMDTNFNVKKNVEKVLIEKSDTPIVPTSMNSWFSYLENCQSIGGLEHIDTSLVTDMSCLFLHCGELKELDLSFFNTSSVIDMSGMFSWTKINLLDVSSFNTSNVKKMNDMFSGVNLDALDLSSFDTSNVVDMRGMFYGSSIKELNLSSFNTSNVKSMNSMFYGFETDELDLSSFNTSSVEDMQCMFNWSRINDLDVSSFNTSKVKHIIAMFGSQINDYLETIDISHFDLSSAEDIKDVSDLYIDTH